MPNLRTTSSLRRRVATRLAFVVAWAPVAGSSGCLFSSSRPAADPEPVDTVATAESAPDPRDQRLARLEVELQQLRDRAAKAELRLMERDAQARQLEQRLAQQQKMLDETIAEVVRTKAKLRGTESKAEAASQLAESEIALKALEDVAGGPATPEYRQAMELVEAGTREFSEDNFGGAIYLSSQAKTLISIAQARLGERVGWETTEGEVPFDAPLPLEVMTNSNLRDGPGLEHTVITILQSGEPVIGYSYKGEWVRVRLDDGREGWVYQALLTSR